MCRIRNQVEMEMRCAFPNLYSSTQGSSRFPPTSAAQQVQRPPVPTPSISIGAIESLIGRVQRNVSSSNPSPMRNRGVEPNSTMPYKVTYRQHSGKRPATISGRTFVKDTVADLGGGSRFPLKPPFAATV